MFIFVGKISLKFELLIRKFHGSRPDNRCTALDEYVWRKDEHYSYDLVEEYDNYRGVKGYVFELTSQKWLDESVYHIKKTKGQMDNLSILQYCARIRDTYFLQNTSCPLYMRSTVYGIK